MSILSRPDTFRPHRDWLTLPFTPQVKPEERTDSILWTTVVDPFSSSQGPSEDLQFALVSTLTTTTTPSSADTEFSIEHPWIPDPSPEPEDVATNWVELQLCSALPGVGVLDPATPASPTSSSIEWYSQTAFQFLDARSSPSPTTSPTAEESKHPNRKSRFDKARKWAHAQISSSKMNKSSLKDGNFFRCPICPHTSRSKRSNKMDHLYGHAPANLQPPKAVCATCGNEYRQQRSLQRHERRSHGVRK